MTRLGAALGALVVTLVASLAMILTGAARADQVIVTIVYDSGGFSPSPAAAPYRSYLRFTNNSGLQLRVRSTGGVCGFDETIPGFSTSKTLGPLAKSGQCTYRGATALGSATGVINVAPKPETSPTPTPTATPAPTPTKTASPSSTPHPSASSTTSPAATQSPTPSPTIISETQSPPPLQTPSPSGNGLPPNPSPSQSIGPSAAHFDLKDVGRRSLGLPGALAALAVVALLGAIARVLSAEAAR